MNQESQKIAENPPKSLIIVENRLKINLESQKILENPLKNELQIPKNQIKSLKVPENP